MSALSRWAIAGRSIARWPGMLEMPSLRTVAGSRRSQRSPLTRRHEHCDVGGAFGLAQGPLNSVSGALLYLCPVFMHVIWDASAKAPVSNGGNGDQKRRQHDA